MKKGLTTYQEARREDTYKTAAFYEEAIARKRALGHDLNVYELALEETAKRLRETQEQFDGLSKKRAQLDGGIAALRHHIATDYPDEAKELFEVGIKTDEK